MLELICGRRRSRHRYLNRISSLAESFESSAAVTKNGNFKCTAFNTSTCSAATCTMPVFIFLLTDSPGRGRTTPSTATTYSSLKSFIVE
nr:hypothetical protein Iba_chr06eCG2110 [Ipomoea batatas]GME19517.1 hypothetical protein Iba_scaffold23059CG0070 [Ipomoea batatas]